jgi:hypothetical protein
MMQLLLFAALIIGRFSCCRADPVQQSNSLLPSNELPSNELHDGSSLASEFFPFAIPIHLLHVKGSESIATMMQYPLKPSKIGFLFRNFPIAQLINLAAYRKKWDEVAYMLKHGVKPRSLTYSIRRAALLGMQKDYETLCKSAGYNQNYETEYEKAKSEVQSVKTRMLHILDFTEHKEPSIEDHDD